MFGGLVYEKLLTQIVDFYFDDYEDHGSEFEPFFLLNDILRFWRTLTLNYEHDRHRLQVAGTDARGDAVAKSALKNYKLKYSRLLICFSMVAWLVSVQNPGKEGIVLACRMTPAERLKSVGAANGKDDVVEELLAMYDDFLDVTQGEKAKVLARFREKTDREELTERATLFGDLFSELVNDVAREQIRRYLTV